MCKLLIFFQNLNFSLQKGQKTFPSLRQFLQNTQKSFLYLKLIFFFEEMGCTSHRVPIQKESNTKQDAKVEKDDAPTMPKQEIVSRACGYQFETDNSSPKISNYPKQSEKDKQFSTEKLVKNYRDCENYYKEHDLDTAVLHARVVKQEISRMNVSDRSILKNPTIEQIAKLIQKVQHEHTDMVNFEHQIKQEGWVQKSNKKGLKISTRREYEDGTVGVMIQSILDIPFEVFISVLIEIDFYKEFIPFMKVSYFEKQVDRNCRIGYAQSHFPILSVRQAFFQGIGYNRLHHNNTLFLYTRSLHNRPDLQEKLSYKCKINQEYVQLQYKYFVVIYEPIDRVRGRVTVSMNVDVKLNFVPMWIQDKISEDFGQDFFKNLVKISKKFKNSVWQQNVKKSPALFNFFHDALKNHLDELQKKGTKFPLS